MAHRDAARRFRRIFLQTVSIAILCAAASASASAQVIYALPGTPANTQQFSSIQAFGDSYVDIGNLFKIVGPSAVYPTGRFSGGTNYIDTTSALLGIPQANFAVGGATTGPGNTVLGPANGGFQQQWQYVLATGTRFLPTDLIMLNIGGNDARLYEMNGGTVAGAAAASVPSAIAATVGIGALVGAGAKTIVFTAGDVGQLPEVAGNPIAAAGSAFSQAYNFQLQASLGFLAASGIRVEYVDVGLIGQEIKANPAIYGVANTGACPIACVGNPALQNQYLFYVDGIHLTSLGFAIVGEYVVNRLNAPLTFSAQGDLGMSATSGFVSTMFGRLDLFGAQMNSMADAPLAYAETQVIKGPLAKISTAPPPAPYSVYILVNGGFGKRSATSVSTGYDWDSVGGTIGAEYRFGREAIIGAAFDYSNPTARLKSGAGQTDLNAYQFGLYGAWTRSNFFAQGLFSYGIQSYTNARPGVVSQITSNPSGSSLAAAGKVGYLFDAGFARVGPIAGLTYASSQVNAFTETGDLALNLSAGRQRVEALIGSAGLQARYPLLIAGRRLDPYINLTAENDFNGSGRLIQYSATSAPLIVNTWTIPKQSQNVYGRVAAGISADMGYGVALSINLTQTFGRKGGDDFGGQGGIKVSF